MGYIKLRRLHESHETQLPAELLGMTVGEMLDKVGELDTRGDAEYEVVEAALKAITDKILGTGYQSDEVDFTPDGVEGANDDEEMIDSDEQQIPTYDDIAAGQETYSGGGMDSGLDGFEF